MENLKEELKYGKKGITLISLVVTIIVLLILAGTTIAMLTGENGILLKANEAKMATELSKYKEELELYKIEKTSENLEFEEETLTAGKKELNYNTKPENEDGNIKTIIKDISDEYFEKLEIIKGELLITTVNDSEIKIAQRLGIQVNPYDIRDGVLWSANGNLSLLGDNTGSLTIPDSVISIGEGAFANLKGLKTIIIPSSVKRIEKNAFYGNKTLETVIMQEKENTDGTFEGVEYIGEGAFKDCSNLKNIQFAENTLSEIKEEVFMYCGNLTKIKIPKNITKLPMYTFYNCSNLTDIELPYNLTTIENNAFGRCINLSEIEIPENVKSIGTSSFYDCSKLENIILNNNNFIYADGMLRTNPEIGATEILFISVIKLKNITEFSIPEGIQTFNISLNNYQNIKKINIPRSLETININSFPSSIENINIDEENKNFKIYNNNCLYNYNMTQLILCYTKEKNVNLYENTKIISERAFKSAINLEELKLPETIATISGQIFSDIENVKNLYIGKNVSYIDSLFCYYKYNVNVELNNENPYYKIEDNVLYDIRDKNNIILVTVLYQITDKFYINKKVDTIGNHSFHNQNMMKSVDIPNGVTKIESSFNYCNALTEMNIPASVEKIDKTCFNNSPNITKITIDKPKGSILDSPWGCIYGDKAIIWNN